MHAAHNLKAHNNMAVGGSAYAWRRGWLLACSTATATRGGATTTHAGLLLQAIHPRRHYADRGSQDDEAKKPEGTWWEAVVGAGER